MSGVVKPRLLLRVKRTFRSLEDRRRARLDETREPADTAWYAMMARISAADRAATERRISAAAMELDRLS